MIIMNYSVNTYNALYALASFCECDYPNEVRQCGKILNKYVLDSDDPEAGEFIWEAMKLAVDDPSRCYEVLNTIDGLLN